MRKPKTITRNAIPSFAVVVDGKTEGWYLQMLKRNRQDIRVNIRPELPSEKTIEEQYDLVCDLAGKEFDKVFWIVDLDTIIKESRETPTGRETPLNRFVKYRTKLKKHTNVVVIVNNPCLEFWFLLHYEKTSKHFNTCSEAEKQLKKYLPNYEKTQKFFTKEGNDIYLQLEPYLKTALEHAIALGSFDMQDPTKAMCEMDLFFHSEELKKYF